MKATVHIVDDDNSFRIALARLLRAVGYNVQEYASAGAFLVAQRELESGCVLLDIRMPGPSGLELQDALARSEQKLPVIFLTGHGDIPTTVRAMKAGAVDFLTKPVNREALLAAVEAAIAQDAKARAMRETLRELHARYETLTPRERQVLGGVISGHPNKQIAAELGTAERTIKAHRAQVMDKMRVSSLAELVQACDRLEARYGMRDA